MRTKIIIALFTILLISCEKLTSDKSSIKSSDINDGTVVYSKKLERDTVERTKTDKRNFVKQDIMRFSDGKYGMNTWVYIDGHPVCVLTVAENDNEGRIVNTWFVKSITIDVKKAQWERAEKILKEHLKKITPYKQ